VGRPRSYTNRRGGRHYRAIASVTAAHDSHAYLARSDWILPMPARTPSPPAAASDELAEIAAENPRHRIWRETTYDGIRYIAQSLDLGVHPASLVRWWYQRERAWWRRSGDRDETGWQTAAASHPTGYSSGAASSPRTPSASGTT
jgi:hypothetical protein